MTDDYAPIEEPLPDEPEPPKNDPVTVDGEGNPVPEPTEE